MTHLPQHGRLSCSCYCHQDCCTAHRRSLPQIILTFRCQQMFKDSRCIAGLSERVAADQPPGCLPLGRRGSSLCLCCDSAELQFQVSAFLSKHLGFCYASYGVRLGRKCGKLGFIFLGGGPQERNNCKFAKQGQKDPHTWSFVDHKRIMH